MAKRRPPIAAADLAAKLQANPAFVERQAERARMRAERIARHREEEASLLADLHAVGFDVTAVSDLVNSDTNRDKAIPILVKHLLLPYSEGLREFIARALAIPAAIMVWPILVAEYRKAVELPDRSSAKNGLAVALSATATDKTIPELLALIRDRSHGRSRLLLLPALRRSVSRMAKDALVELVSDPDFAKEIASWNRGRK